MDCIYCGSKTKIINSRAQKADHQTWRRHKCLNCHSTITSVEQITYTDALRVHKRDKQIEPFVRDKLFLSIYQSVRHLDSPTIIATNLTTTVLRHMLKNLSGPLISSDQLAKLVCQTLKQYDAAGAVRYLSFQTKLQIPSDIHRSLK